MIEFNKEGARVSGGLYGALMARGLEKQKTFKLNIEKSSVFSYLTSLPFNSNFINEFHIGCSSDRRPPSFIYYSPGFRENEVMYLVYDREINGKSGDMFPRDEKGERNLEALAAQFSNPSLYDEDIRLGYTGIDGGLCINSHVDVFIKNNVIDRIDNIQDLQGMGMDKFLRNAIDSRIKGSVLDYKKGPNKKNKVLINGWEGRDLKKMGISAGKLVSEIIRLYDGSVGDVKLLNELKFDV